MAPPVPSRPHRYASVIVRSIFVAVVTFMLTEFTGRFIASQILPPRYAATAQIQVVNPAGTDGDAGYQKDVTTALHDPSLLLPIVEDLQLDTAWETPATDTEPATPLTQTEALEYLTKRLKVSRLGKTDVFEITVATAVPQQAADIANAIAVRYKTTRDAEDVQGNQHSLDAINDQVAAQTELVRDKEAALQKLRGSPGSGAQTPAFLDAQNELAKNQAQLDALITRREQDKADVALAQGPVSVLRRADVPQQPNHHVAHMVTHVAAVILAILMTCFFEVIMLFLRAGERE